MRSAPSMASLVRTSGPSVMWTILDMPASRESEWSTTGRVRRETRTTAERCWRAVVWCTSAWVGAIDGDQLIRARGNETRPSSCSSLCDNTTNRGRASGSSAGDQPRRRRRRARTDGGVVPSARSSMEMLSNRSTSSMVNLAPFTLRTKAMDPWLSFAERNFFRAFSSSMGTSTVAAD